MRTGRRKKLRALAAKMGRQSQGLLPVTESMLDIFDLVVTPRELDVLLGMSEEALPLEALQARTGLDGAELSAIVDGAAAKGLVWTRRAGSGGRLYGLAPIMPGWFELFLAGGKETPDRKAFAGLLTRLLDDYGRLNVAPVRQLMNLYFRRTGPLRSIAAIAPSPGGKGRKVVEVGERVKGGELAVFPHGTVNELIERHGRDGNIAVMHCFCRQHHKLTGGSCRYDLPAESCLVLGAFTDHIVDQGIGRRISKPEALEIVALVQGKGAVHQVFYERGETGGPELAICNCCPDCCEILRCYRRGVTSLQTIAYFSAQVCDPGRCTACGKCEDACPVWAVSVGENGSLVDPDRCIGCGQCARHCRRGVIRLSPGRRTVFLPLMSPEEARRRAGPPPRR